MRYPEHEIHKEKIDILFLAIPNQSETFDGIKI